MTNKPIHPFFFALYPVLALLANNVGQVDLSAAYRPIIFVLIGTAALLLLLRGIFGDWRRAGVISATIIILFFTYGHIYTLLKNIEILGVGIGRHRFLLPVWLALIIFGIWWSVSKLSAYPKTNQTLNSIALLLLFFLWSR
ncbi:MAG: hypothetical protein HN390_06055 [Anaerolineae bacterium]|jgi:hypothetical protein|nr:hypothetical protein [Anaerolineae bacterium]MBT7190392.1 hypothetical protein [Anaerolineae bacterium]MBT7989170.1 hypothetical protein [Anaerolineae bacterium]